MWSTQILSGALLLAFVAGAPLVSTLPKDLSAQGLSDLTGDGELIHLPAHHASPFNAAIVTRSNRACSTVEGLLLDVEGYPRLWPDITEVRLLSRQGKLTRYEFEVSLMLAPTMKGLIEHVGKNVVLFHDVETGGRIWYELSDHGGGCHLRYNIQQPEGRHAPFVDVVTRMEKNGADAAELAAALASLRGVARPEAAARQANPRSAEAQRTWDELASTGTVLRTLRRPNKHVALVGKRRVDAAPSAVLASIRDRTRYPAKIENVRDVVVGERGVEWELGYLGGRVSIETAVVERGSVTAARGLTVMERIVDGDVRGGEWHWTVRAVDGGTEVELFMDFDLAAGSSVLRGLARQHEAIESAMVMQLFLSLLGQIVEGRPLPLEARVAKVP